MKRRIQTLKELIPYRKFYSDDSLWNKIPKVAKRLGSEVTYYALILYYTMLSPGVSIKNKAVICGALGYLILPADFLPDIIPILGLTDDIAAIKLAYDAIRTSVTPDIEMKARMKSASWFSENG